MASLQLPIHSYQLRSKQASSARLLNCYAEATPGDAKAPVLLNRAPGVSVWTTVGDGPIHALHAAHGYLYAVSNTKLYRIDSAKTATLLGDIGTVASIDISSNTDTVVVVNEPAAYYWDGATFGTISDADFTARDAGDVEFIDNYLLFREPDSGRFFGSDLNSATAYDALDFATAEGYADDLVGMKTDHRQVLLFGAESVEIWENIGSTGFPFERAVNGLIEIGCLAGRSIAKIDNSVMWFASDYTIRRLEGITPVRVSTHAVEQSLVDTTAEDAKAYTYSQDGHFFYVLVLPEITWVYDAVTKEWHERQTYGSDTYLPGSHARAFTLELVGNSTTNEIGQLDNEVYAEWGDVQRMEWTYQPVYSEGRTAIHDRLEVILEKGVGLTTGQGSDPQIMLDYSDDGGMTWETLPTRSIGAIGKYETRAVWTSLGSSKNRVYRMAISDPVKVTVTDTLLEVRGGRL